MAHHFSQPRPRRKARSEAQQLWNQAVGLASKFWENLTDEQRLTWNTTASNQRSTGQRCFVSLNALRCFNNEEPQLLPPSPGVPSVARGLRKLLFSNCRGRVSLKMALALAPGARYTVWASRPHNRG